MNRCNLGDYSERARVITTRGQACSQLGVLAILVGAVIVIGCLGHQIEIASLFVSLFGDITVSDVSRETIHSPIPRTMPPVKRITVVNIAPYQQRSLSSLQLIYHRHSQRSLMRKEKLVSFN